VVVVAPILCRRGLLLLLLLLWGISHHYHHYRRYCLVVPDLGSSIHLLSFGRPASSSSLARERTTPRTLPIRRVGFNQGAQVEPAAAKYRKARDRTNS